MPRIVEVDRTNLGQSRIVERDAAPLAESEVRLRVDSFSVTANNVTYAVAGDAFRYWDFFPASDGYGVVPMWGHATIAQSNHSDLAVGERVYGYLPMGEELVVQLAGVTPAGFSDGAAHRQPMSPFYNQYARLANDPEHDPAREAERMLFGPLFKTGFLIESFMRGEGWFGAQQAVLTSASSKTAMALASVMRAKSPGIRRIGLTSASNAEFVRSGGFFDAVLAYDAIADVPAQPSVSVDFAGNAPVLHTIHTHLRDALRYSCTVGATHVGQGFGGPQRDIPGPNPTLFFAPTHAMEAIKKVGAKAFGQDVAESWRTFVGEAAGALRIDERRGLEAARDAFADTLGGRADPAVGIIVKP
ncbi:DUF2855 family protein [Tsuneonella amylolytica]|uniref:DUF2855 family protein n=1 Tax=Tsuneonella amylolytica TaxID=2338327 RepID=UPI000EAA6F53|nr:DUF2855 family protein [Tsuneonella amylolytica]